MRDIVKGSLFLVSMLMFFSGIYGMCTRSSSSPNDQPFELYAMGTFIIFLASIVFNVWRVTNGGGSLQSVLTLTAVISISCIVYGIYIDHNTITIDIHELIVPPVVSGYNGEGYISEDAFLDPDKVSEIIADIDNDKRQAQLEYVLGTGAFYYDYYENSEDIIPRKNNELRNGDKIYVEYKCYDELAVKYHFCFDNTFNQFYVEGLAEKPVIDWEISESQLMEMAIIHCQDLGYFANSAEVTAQYEDGKKVKVIVKYIHDGRSETVNSYIIDRITLQDDHGPKVIDFTEEYYKVINK